MAISSIFQKEQNSINLIKVYIFNPKILALNIIHGFYSQLPGKIQLKLNYTTYIHYKLAWTMEKGLATGEALDPVIWKLFILAFGLSNGMNFDEKEEKILSVFLSNFVFKIFLK